VGVEEIALPLLLAGAGAATSYVQAEQQNHAAKKAEASTKQAAIVQTKQLADQAGLDREKSLRQARATRARALTIASGSGFEIGSSDIDSLLAAITGDANTNLGIIETNRQNSTALVQSRRDAELASIQSKESSPFLSAFTGLFGGAQLGLGIDSGINQISDRAEAQARLAAANAGNVIK